MIKVNALIAGLTGYIGLQLVKLLLNHKNVKIKYLCGNTSQGKIISFFDKDLKNKKLPKIIKFNKKLLSNVDVVFTALPNGETQNLSKLLKKLHGRRVLVHLFSFTHTRRLLFYDAQLGCCHRRGGGGGGGRDAPGHWASAWARARPSRPSRPTAPSLEPCRCSFLRSESVL